ncbi:MAG: zinc-dependent metalloprotease family protein [Gammaproteobacteria bacterium]
MTIILRPLASLRALVVLPIALCVVTPLQALAQPEVSILYHEPFVLNNAAADSIEFDAYGRRFVLLIDATKPGASGPDVKLISARLKDAPGSWARLSLRGDRVSGMIRVADDTYVIEPRASLHGALMVGEVTGSSPNVIYRLADTMVAPGLLSCDTHDGLKQVDGKTALASLTAEMGAASVLATNGDIATVGVFADSFLVNRLQDDTLPTLEQVFATVSGMYAEQVGVDLDVVTIDVSTNINDDPTGTQRFGSDVLDELGAWRVANQTDLAITHLVTNRSLINIADDTPGANLDDSRYQIAGISYLGTPGRTGVCDARTGASVSEWLGSGLTTLVIAHEIGHNFGAPHDGEFAEAGETPNPCAVVPPDTFLMSPTLRGPRTDEFSQCSLEQIAPVVAAARCLRPSTQLAAEANPSDEGGGGGVGPAALLTLCSLVIIRRRRAVAERN